tara:strand:- start:259 stop:774 length:516 start_codon:yes stop_codon:yes gene_type:complete
MKLKYYKRKEQKDTKAYSDVWMTPREFAHKVVDHFAPTGRVLEPCSGTEYGGYWGHPAFTDWCEVRSGKDFFDWDEKVDWIITNPPYSIIVQMLEGALMVADNVVFAPIKINEIMSSKKRNRMIKELGHQIKEVIIIDTPPKPFPQTGFQYWCIHWQRGYTGPITWTDWRK